jgi:hypothetical protein
MDYMPPGGHRRGTEEQEALLAKLLEHLSDDPAYEPHGDTIISLWDVGQYVKYTDPDGRVHYLRVVVQPYVPPEPGPRPKLP